MVVAPSIERDTLRLRDEFLALPGLRLTATQTATLLSVREVHARQLLEQLKNEGFLGFTQATGYFRQPQSTPGGRTL
jgi:hypothetical protein